MQKLVVSSRFQGNLGLVSFAQLLPLFGNPWPALGTREILTRIGELLDSISTEGTDNAQWQTARLIAETHWVFASKTVMPGSILAAPIFRAKHQKWGFEAELRLDRSSEVKIHVDTGPEDDVKVRRITVYCHEPVVRFAGELQAIGLKYG